MSSRPRLIDMLTSRNFFEHFEHFLVVENLLSSRHRHANI